MTLKEYLIDVKKLLKECPEALNYEVVCSSDDEGNEFNPVCFSPSVGLYKNREFNTILDEDFDKNSEPNAVCLN